MTHKRPGWNRLPAFRVLEERNPDLFTILYRIAVEDNRRTEPETKVIDAKPRKE